MQVVAAGLCHSDISVIDGTIPWQYPCVLGHEGAGIVAEVGEAVTNVKPGDHVVLHTLAFCGLCKYCVTGQPARCRKSLGNASQPFTLARRAGVELRRRVVLLRVHRWSRPTSA